MTDQPSDKTATGVEISVGHLSYSIYLTQTGKWKRILNDVSLQLKPNTLTALMGPSGSGKRFVLFRFQFVLHCANIFGCIC